MKTLVTGGAGFIGSHLIEALLNEGHKVIALDNISKQKARNLSHLFNNKDLSFIKGDILNRAFMEKQIKKVDFVFHLAAAVGVKRVIENSLSSLNVNVIGTHHILELATKFKKKVLITSTSEIYGKNPKIPFEENDDRVVGSTSQPRWAYSCAKAIDEFYAFAYNREKGLQVIIVRPFNVTGPRQTGTFGMVLPRFVEAALNNETINIFGDGKQTRCFCHVKDAVRGIMMLIKSKKAYGEAFNVGNPSPISIKELAKKIIKLSGSRSKIKFINPKKVYKGVFEDIKDRKPSIAKINKCVGYKPKLTLSDIINDIIELRRYEA
jgi:UDP-glucose 4-epimerase